ncbi:MAG: HDOD domain-containing protein [Desulfobulbaceae bacterium]|nr:HDOD domain-containing protein [Desulfobulbaceae bacterium]
MQTEYIASGEYYIASSESKLLKVLLGSCVGVALFDAAANVGGIVHLLLPEPATLGSTWSPGSYATSGLPMFINALLSSGAKPENLQAVVAGGALFGRISQQDIALNIGGRCVEKVHSILKEWQIPILKEESCGFSPSVLALNTKNWQSEIVTRFAEPSAEMLPSRLTHKEVGEAIRGITPIPQAALGIIHLISGGDYDATEIGRIVETDQVLAAKILKLCNSPLFGVKRTIDSIEEAVVILGGSHMLQMVATAAIDSLLAEHQGGYAMLKGGMYKHAIGTAHAAKIIAGHHGGVSPGVAYAAGLLHDIGKVVLDQYFCHFRPLFYQSCDQSDQDLIELEHQFLGVEHQEVGLLLAKEWSLPESISQAIAHHHRPEQAAGYAELVHIIYLADLLTTWYLAGLEFERINTDALQSRLRFLNIVSNQLPDLIEKVPWKTVMYL